MNSQKDIPPLPVEHHTTPMSDERVRLIVRQELAMHSQIEFAGAEPADTPTLQEALDEARRQEKAYAELKYRPSSTVDVRRMADAGEREARTARVWLTKFFMNHRAKESSEKEKQTEA